MRTTPSVRLYARVLLALATLGVASPASAQFTPRSVGSDAVGSKYWIEGSVGIWYPTATMSISSDSLGIPGDNIDFKKDLGLEDNSFSEFHLELRPAKWFKIRYQYIPITFTQEAVITREIVFQGRTYTVGIPVNSGIDWKAHRFGLEFDVISRDKWFVGLVLDVKQTDVAAYLEAPGLRRESADARAPIPAIGGAFRFFFIRNASFSGEITAFSIPDDLIEDVDGHYWDYDFYGTYNFTRNFGAKLGYRRFDLGYLIDEDRGDFDLRGFYIGGVVRY